MQQIGVQNLVTDYVTELTYYQQCRTF